MMTVGELKKFLESVNDDSLEVCYLPPDVDLSSCYTIKGAILVENATIGIEKSKGVYLLEE